MIVLANLEGQSTISRRFRRKFIGMSQNFVLKLVQGFHEFCRVRCIGRQIISEKPTMLRARRPPGREVPHHSSPPDGAAGEDEEGGAGDGAVGVEVEEAVNGEGGVGRELGLEESGFVCGEGATEAVGEELYVGNDGEGEGRGRVGGGWRCGVLHDTPPVHILRLFPRSSCHCPLDA